jgi:iron complex outermembrane receptor protein
LSDSWKTRLVLWLEQRSLQPGDCPAGSGGQQPCRRNPAAPANGGHYDYETRYTALDFIGDQMLFGQRHELLVGVDNEAQDRYRGKTYRNTSTAAGNLDINNPVYGNLAEPSTVSATQSNAKPADLDLAVPQGQLAPQRPVDFWCSAGAAALRPVRHPGFCQHVIARQQWRSVHPPAGVVYQPTEAWSLYANYSRSFVPNTDTDDQGNTFDPEEGVSREVGPSLRRRTRSTSTWPCSISSKRTW